ncbi:hypothetical protein AX16_009841 [Volvariella volvacea WC 439]|nr:hypothetical protein AX16_009841 [Volvariella volvacea WC 439]
MVTRPIPVIESPASFDTHVSYESWSSRPPSIRSVEDDDRDQNSAHIYQLGAPTCGGDMQVEGPRVLKQHPRFYMSEQSIVIRVQNTYFKVPSYYFERDSERFRDLIRSKPMHYSPGSKTQVIKLSHVTTLDFERFLCVLYPLRFDHYEAASSEEWISILKVATRWRFESVRELAISNLSFSLENSPVDKVVIGRKYDAPQLVKEGCEALCTVNTPLTEDEGKSLGMWTVIKIMQARANIFHSAIEMEKDNQSAVIANIFGDENHQRLDASSNETLVDTELEEDEKAQERNEGTTRASSTAPDASDWEYPGSNACWDLDNALDAKSGGVTPTQKTIRRRPSKALARYKKAKGQSTDDFVSGEPTTRGRKRATTIRVQNFNSRSLSPGDRSNTVVPHVSALHTPNPSPVLPASLRSLKKPKELRPV